MRRCVDEYKELPRVRMEDQVEDRPPDLFRTARSDLYCDISVDGAVEFAVTSVGTERNEDLVSGEPVTENRPENADSI
jgi:hypothetical protein